MNNASRNDLIIAKTTNRRTNKKTGEQNLSEVCTFERKKP
jgi:hypothetical protein